MICLYIHVLSMQTEMHAGKFILLGMLSDTPEIYTYKIPVAFRLLSLSPEQNDKWKSSYDYIWWLKEDNLLLSKDSFWMQCLGPKHDCIWCINQSSQTVDWKIKVEREKKTLPNVTLYNYAWVRRHANHWIKYCGQSNRQTIIKKTSQNQTHLEVNTLVHGAFLQHWVKNAGSFMHNRNLCHTYVFNN